MVKEVSPGLNTRGSPVAAAVLHRWIKPSAGRCLSRTRVVPWIISRHLPIDHPGTYGCALSAPFLICRVDSLVFRAAIEQDPEQLCRSEGRMYPFPGYQVGWARKTPPPGIPRCRQGSPVSGRPRDALQRESSRICCAEYPLIVTAERGYSAKSARSPGAKPDGGMPMSAAGAVAVFRIRSGRVIFRVEHFGHEQGYHGLHARYPRRRIGGTGVLFPPWCGGHDRMR